jgi:hypothetical protein
MANSPGAAIFGGIIGLVFLALGVLLIAGIYHLFAMMFGARGGYVGTFRAVVYAWSPMILVTLLNLVLIIAVPAAVQVGGILSLIVLIWSFVLLVIGVREIHGLSTGAAFGVAVIPTIIMIGLVLLLFFAIFAAVIGALMGQNPAAFGNPNGFGGANGLPGPSGLPPGFGRPGGLGQ